MERKAVLVRGFSLVRRHVEHHLESASAVCDGMYKPSHSTGSVESLVGLMTCIRSVSKFVPVRAWGGREKTIFEDKCRSMTRRKQTKCRGSLLRSALYGGGAYSVWRRHGSEEGRSEVYVHLEGRWARDGVCTGYARVVFRTAWTNLCVCDVRVFLYLRVSVLLSASFLRV